MASTDLTQTDRFRTVASARPRSEVHASSLATSVLGALASLKLTVVLFGLLIFLVFAGTLAQVDRGIWYVVDHAYFRVWIATIELRAFERLFQTLLPFYPFSWDLDPSLRFRFPGGWLIGTVMAVNLLAAHAMRFKIAASGRRLVIGTAVIAVGMLATWLVIRSGMDEAFESELSPAFNNMLWHSLRGCLAGLVLLGAYVLTLTSAHWRRAEWLILAGLEALLALLAFWLLLNPEARLDPAGLRILWQLGKATGASAVLLVGCVLVFNKRAGIVLLHGGVAVMMLSELLTGLYSTEANMRITEGESANYTYDIRATELAVVDRSPEGSDQVVAVPAAMLSAAEGQDEAVIRLPDLPFDLQVLDWQENSWLRDPPPGERNLANRGTGRVVVAEELRPGTGVESDQVDVPSAYVRLLDKETGQPLGSYLVSQSSYPFILMGMDGEGAATLPDQTVEVGGKEYDLALRFVRDYKPYTLMLKDFATRNYTGTQTAKNYSSLVRLQDPERKVDRDVKIWMNNPLRYAGETYYQSSFDPTTETTTVLQVVSNPGWMMPYTACMIVGLGMLAHFGIVLERFIRRRSEQFARSAAIGPRASTSQGGLFRPETAGVYADTQAGSSRLGQLARWFPLIVLVLAAGYAAGKTRMPKDNPLEMQIHEFGKLPVAFQGRIKPYDTVARNTLQILSGRQEVIVEADQQTGPAAEEYRLPAIRWLLDAISGAEGGEDYRVFRIDNLELLDTLELERRPGSFRYSASELRGQMEEFLRQYALARELEEAEEPLSLLQRKVLQLGKQLSLYRGVVESFKSPDDLLLVLQPGQETPEDEVILEIRKARGVASSLSESTVPRAVPPTTWDGKWTTFYEGVLNLVLFRSDPAARNPASEQLAFLLMAYSEGDKIEFNKQLSAYKVTLAGYQQQLAEHRRELAASDIAASEVMSLSKSRFETFYNNFSPFYYASVLYLLAFALAVLAWLGWEGPLNRAALCLLVFTFLLHTFALVGRIYISGRPPVTNLYSSAIFIGWGVVLFGLVLEALYKMGLGNVLASVVGFLTLLVAHNLSLDGDTFIVLVAVLDTQFWLATHVVCITLGYAATFAAGGLGVLYVLLAHVLPKLDRGDRQVLSRMIYGTLCFAIFFSFVGTVLGGLWADDSWGRFWGWDPKENGALIIVLWNALVLHARWGGMVTPLGLAMLAIGGNIVTAWSWFGVNELGVGLHAYGASESSTALWLLTFALSQFALIALGWVPFDRLRDDGHAAPAA